MASPAQAFSLNWSFNATQASGGATIGTVSGTISGLQDNTTNTSGLTATVLDTPDNQYEGVTFNLGSSGSITLASGVVTVSDVVFTGSSLGGSDELYLGLVNDYPDYYLPSSGGYRLSSPPTGGTTFSSASPVPFEFDPSFGVVALGGIWAGRKVIKKIKTSKKSV